MNTSSKQVALDRVDLVFRMALPSCFRAMLYGGLKESSEAEIELKGADAVAFRAVLQ